MRKVDRSGEDDIATIPLKHIDDRCNFLGVIVLWRKAVEGIQYCKLTALFHRNSWWYATYVGYGYESSEDSQVRTAK